MKEEYVILVGEPDKSGDLIISLEKILQHVLEKQDMKT
jgi:hypothetical protein